MKTGRLYFSVFLFLILLSSRAAAQQNTADVVGTVTDNSGAVVPGAAVTLTNVNTGIVQATVASNTGDYIFPQLQVGTYRVKVEAKGFKTFSAENVTLAAGDRVRVDAPLQVGDVQQVVEVSAATAPALQTDSSNLGTLVTQQAVQDLPLNGRNVIKLVQLSAGVNQGTPNDLQSGNRPDDRRQTATYSVNGQNDNVNNNMIDGMDNNERLIATVGIRPSIDAIQEVNVSTNLYDASLSRTGGGVVDVITKSGTNDFHGSLYEFFRNAVLNTNPNYSFPANYNASTGALNYTNVLPKPAFRQNQYGVSLGGPIRKNKTFFFGDFEQFRQAFGVPLTFTVPTLCNHGLAACPDGNTQFGDFSDQTDISQYGGGAACTPNTALVAAGTCPYVVIPAASITPLGRAYFNMYPLPTSAGISNNYSSNPARTQNATTFDGRIDQHFSDADSLYARYSFNDITTVTPDGFSSVRIDPATGNLVKTGGVLVHPGANSGNNSFPGQAKERQQNIALSYAHVFGPNLVASLKANYLRSVIQSLQLNYGSNASNALGITCNSVQCVNVPNTPAASGLFQAGPTGFTALGDASFLPILYLDNTFQYSGGLTWNKGSQSIRMGVGLVRRRATFGQSNSPQGGDAFSGGFTGVSLGDLLEGLGSGGNGFGGLRDISLVQPGLREWEPNAYFQDDWRRTRWLTLNLGMRYDIFTPYTEKTGRITNWNPATGLVVGPSLPGAQHAGNTALVRTDYGNLAPRFGFAATLPHSLVLRGGFGLSFFEDNTGASSSMKNAPYSFTYNCKVQVGSGSNTVCPAGLANGATANYGPPPGPSSSVNQTGGPALSGGTLSPSLNVGQILVPANCVNLGDAGCKAPNNPYATMSLTNIIWPNFPNNYLEQFNLQAQKQFGANVVTLGYVGELGRHNKVDYNINAKSNYTQLSLPYNPLAVDYPWLATATVDEEVSKWASNSYNALQATFVRRFSRGLTVNLNYTWAHSLADGQAPCKPTVSPSILGFGTATKYTNPCYYDNPKQQTTTTIPTNALVESSLESGLFQGGNSGQDVADRFAWQLNYQPAFGKSLTGISGFLAKGWSFNMTGSWQTGLPFTVTAGKTYVNTMGGGRPDQNGSGKGAHSELLNWINPVAFLQPSPNTYGNEESNQFFGPVQRSIDASLFKEIPVTERVHAQLRVEVFNLFNTPNFSTPSGAVPAFNGTSCPVNGTASASNNNVCGTGLLQNPASPTSLHVGTITSLNNNISSRQVQLALKLLF